MKQESDTTANIAIVWGDMFSIEETSYFSFVKHNNRTQIFVELILM